MIKSFKDPEAEKIYHRQKSRKLPGDIQQITLRKLRMLNNAATINDVRNPPNNHLEKLKGNRARQYSVRINDRWRICFYWRENNVFDVEIVDYH